MNYKALTNILSVVILAAVFIAAGLTGDRINSIEQELADANDVIVSLTEYNELLTQGIVDNNNSIEDMQDYTIGLSEQLVSLQRQTSLMQVTINNQAKNVEAISDEQEEEYTPAASSFDLKLLNNDSIFQLNYEINDVVLINGSAEATVQTVIHLEIIDKNGFILVEKDIGIGNEGRWTSKYLIPNLDPGKYTIRVNDDFIEDTIDFVVR